MKNYKYVVLVVIILALVAGLLSYRSCRQRVSEETLSVAMAPYQDMAMLVNIENLGLEKKYGVNVELISMDWENIVPSIASSGQTADVGFASFIEYLNKEKNLNTSGDDPVLFIYPAYIFKGGAFVTFKEDIPTLTSEKINDREMVKSLLTRKIGAQKSSVYEMMVFSLARRAAVPIDSIKIIDTPLNDGILAAQSGSLDIAEAGLTQITEARKQGGHVVLTMEDLGFADITGFICKKSTLEKKRPQIEKLIRMWFESVQYVMSDIDHNSSNSLKYLDSKASTKYTLQQYKEALTQEYFPVSIEEANTNVLSEKGRYSYQRIGEDVRQYLLQVKRVPQPPTVPSFITIQNQ